MDTRENILEQDITQLPLLDVYGVYVKYMNAYFDTKWWQVIKRARLLTVLRAFHFNYKKENDLLQDCYTVIWKDSELLISVQPNLGIVAVNNKLISYEFLRAITDRPMLHQPIVMRLGKRDELVFEKFENVVGNN